MTYNVCVSYIYIHDAVSDMEYVYEVSSYRERERRDPIATYVQYKYNIKNW